MQLTVSVKATLITAAVVQYKTALAQHMRTVTVTIVRHMRGGAAEHQWSE